MGPAAGSVRSRPVQELEGRDLVAAVRRAVDAELTPRQRELLVAMVVKGIPLDALVIKLGSQRNAMYKMMFDARRKLRIALVADGYLNDEKSRDS
jgi:RNA polymerase sigma-70 factor, ECF subfamily